jgi:Ser/Thr protein kinase RdoA (MazF antagonist)
MGELVGHFDRSLESLDLGASTGHFVLPLFEPGLAHRLEESVRWMSSHRNRSRLANEGIENLHSMQLAYSDIPSSQIEETRKLPQITVYNDWHPANILYRWPRIRGLIDFDSLVEAPRIVDFQNALTWVLIGKSRPDPKLATAFSAGYRDVFPLSQLEVSLINDVMMDRVLWLIADIVDEMRVTGTSRRESLALILIKLSVWLYKQDSIS